MMMELGMVMVVGMMMEMRMVTVLGMVMEVRIVMVGVMAVLRLKGYFFWAVGVGGEPINCKP